MTRFDKQARGERVSHAKLTATKVSEIRRLHGQGASLTELAAHFDVSYSAAYGVVSWTTWRHVDPEKCPARLR